MAIPVVRTALRRAARARRLAGWWYRSAAVSLRWPVLLAWALAVVLVPLVPASPRAPGSGDFADILPVDSPAIQVEERSLAQFRVPVLTGTTVVLRTREPLTPATRLAIGRRALAASEPLLRGRAPTAPGSLLAALPIPFAAGRTSATYLFFTQGTSIWTSTHLAHLYASSLRRVAPPGTEVAVTGFVPAQVAQAEHLARALPLFELLSVALIAVIVALVFRSVLAPVAVLAIGAAGYLVYARLLAGVVAGFGVSVPAQLEPVVAALFLGVVTDYCVLFFAGYRDALRGGALRFAGVRRALRLDAPVIAVAGITVAAGILALLATPFRFFRALGPALALTVVAAVVVSLTLTPALMAMLGPRLFSLRGARGLRPAPAGRFRTAALFTALTRRRPAALAAVAGCAVLLLACVPLTGARLSLSFTAGLPPDDQVSRGAAALSAARIRGITAPTEVLIEGEGVTAQRAALGRLQGRLAEVPGVARVIGPAENPSSFELGVVLAASGNAARYIVLLDSDPLGGRAIAVERGLELALPDLLEETGVQGATAAVTGQTRIASEVALRTRQSLESTLLLALALELLVLVLALRSVAAPLAVLLSGLLSTGAALGLTVLLFQDGLDQPGLTFYAPFSTAVLLVALGADYTVFTIGAVWREAQRRPMRDAIRTAMPANARAVTAAGVILATTFASVAVIPLTAFRQIAFTMAVGLLLDTLLVRPLLTPALLTLLGRWARWPSRAHRPEDEPVSAGPA